MESLTRRTRRQYYDHRDLSGSPLVFTRVTRGPGNPRIGQPGPAFSRALGDTVSRRRVEFTRAELSRIAEVSAKYPSVPIVIERVAADGSKITITAGKGEANGDGTDLDEWIRDHNARATEGH